MKKGRSTVGVQRQYTGTAGQVENSQIAVDLTYATDTGHAFIDRALYLPKSWTTDPALLGEAGVPEDTEFATKPALAKQMITRALDTGVTASWVAGDEVYGADPQLRSVLEESGVGYVLALACDHRVATGAGKKRADEIAEQLPKQAWRSRLARACAAWMNTRSAPGPPGSAGPSWPCSRTPSSPSPPPTNEHHEHLRTNSSR